MVSQNSSIATDMDFTLKCNLSSLDTCSGHSDKTENVFPWSRRNQDGIIYYNALPGNLEPQAEDSYRPLNPIRCRQAEDSVISRALLANSHVGKENDCQVFFPEPIQRLALNLNCHIQNEVLTDPSCFRHKDGVKHSQTAHVNSGDFRSTDRTQLCHSNRCDMASLTNKLQNSRYLKPTQQLLHEVVCVSNVAETGSVNLLRKKMSAEISIKNIPKAFQLESVADFQQREALGITAFFTKENQDSQIKLTKLFDLLDKLNCQHEKYCHQIEAVISSFEVIAGCGAAGSYIALTIQAMSRHFSKLREAIVRQIQASRESLSLECLRNTNHCQTTGGFQNLGTIPLRQVWRPLRGLPENSVAILRTWLFEHFLHPYPNDNEKLMLSSQTGLTRNQISNWFINARVRLWKPMIEDMYREEFVKDSKEENTFS